MDDSKYYRDSQPEVKFDAEYESEIRSVLQTQGVKLEANGHFENRSQSSSSRTPLNEDHVFLNDSGQSSSKQ